MEKQNQEKDNNNKSNLIWKIVAITAICALIVVIILYACGVGWKDDDEDEETQKVEYLSSWVENSEAKKKLENFVEDAVNTKSSNYIPLENRIAVFDLDGTLFCETDPNYFDYTLLVHRVLEDTNYKDKASEFEKQVANKIVDQNNGVTGDYSNLPVEHGQAVASAFKGMTLKQFNDYIQEFKKLPMPSYNNMKRGEGWYKPMLEVVEYLQANDFTVFVVSGTDRFIVRGIVDSSPLKVPNSQIIGSDETLVSPKQGNIDGLNYVYNGDESGDEVVLSGNFVIKNLKMNKVTVIAQEIGIQPVLSFGNSSGDQSMAEYATTNNPYNSLAFMLCCDDLVRENGNENSANKMYDMCSEHGWEPISMKNDWKTIYGDGVTKK